jgi:hypothetical protein
MFTDNAAFEQAKEAALALPEDDPSWGGSDWRAGKPIIRSLEGLRIEKQLFWFSTKPGCKAEDDPYYRTAQERYEREAQDYYYYTRHVLFGKADERSVEDFDQWADDAARYFMAWAQLNYTPKSKYEQLRVVKNPDHDYWLDYIITLARKEIPACPLRVESKTSLYTLQNASNSNRPHITGPHWDLLKTNVFRASVDAIDTLLLLSKSPTEPQHQPSFADRFITPSATNPKRGVKSASTASAGPVPLDEANIAALKYLETAPEPTSRGCVDYIKQSCNGSFSLGRLGKLDAWNAHMAKRSADGERRRASRGKSVKSVPLTDSMRAVIPDRRVVDPSDCLDDELDVLESRFLNHPETTDNTKNEYFQLPNENKKLFLVLWESQRDDEDRGEIVPV